ncbi:HetP family heterocyst commitment protein [Leptothermofonsia sp. ETS-13]|uniref:HetP family heterocyst commitment protein n=1 Tax=Leptothermofonsia sp. ETS-13 TaxID=3035696 RepID=UPI003B9DFD62
MNQQILCSESSQRGIDRAMTAEQFTQVIEAILAGKYSWACVLILRFAGYNPLHYIPYRTYNRLVKENNNLRKPEPQGTDRVDNRFYTSTNTNFEKQPSKNCLNQLKDLAYLELINPDPPQIQETGQGLSQIRGGSFSQWLTRRISDFWSAPN